MWKKLSMVFVAALFLLVAAACSSGAQDDQAKKKDEEEITVKHKFGETPVKKNPEKVVVFDFGSLDTLDKLGVEVAGLPKQIVPSYLSKYKEDKYENLGALKEPDFEKIHALKPDLIILSTRQSDLYDQFAEIAPTIYLELDPNNYMKSFEENAKTLGKIFGKEEQVKKELASIQDSIKQEQDKASKTDKKGLVILANDGKVSAFGPGSRFGFIHDELGIAPADKNIEVSRHGQSISFEYIVEQNPDYLFVIDRGAVVGGQSSAKQVVENELVKNTKAYKNKNVVYLDPNYWYLSSGGLQSVSEMIKEVENGIK
ncbi:siderophore ABC transporter substrate-binding protein [Bacillus xiapuensis]|uniref:siderophore ABC transporter substrate-binding protein n=1 Tax=Bacillus xiapuensis TaxID=2014075 RepID=UPI000C2420D7|nr:siderophore ABC transporter substrate-binding protein [Bacillus xiapuensis]